MATAPAKREPISDDDIVTLLHRSEWPLGSTEVADHFEVTQQAAYHRLTKLADSGRVEKRKTGGTTLWRPR